jgi:hypothetical protein
MRDRPTPAQMAEAEAVMTVDEETRSRTHSDGQRIVGDVSATLTTNCDPHKAISPNRARSDRSCADFDPIVAFGRLGIRVSVFQPTGFAKRSFPIILLLVEF